MENKETNNSVENQEEQRKTIETLSKAIGQHSHLIENITKTNKDHEKKMFNREIFFGGLIIVTTGILAYLGKLGGETLAGLIGVIIGYIGARSM